MGEDWDSQILRAGIIAVSHQVTQTWVCSIYEILIKEYHFKSWVDILSHKIIGN